MTRRWLENSWLKAIKMRSRINKKMKAKNFFTKSFWTGSEMIKTSLKMKHYQLSFMPITLLVLQQVSTRSNQQALLTSDFRKKSKFDFAQSLSFSKRLSPSPFHLLTLSLSISVSNSLLPRYSNPASNQTNVTRSLRCGRIRVIWSRDSTKRVKVALVVGHNILVRSLKSVG